MPRLSITESRNLWGPLQDGIDTRLRGRVYSIPQPPAWLQDMAAAVQSAVPGRFGPRRVLIGPNRVRYILEVRREVPVLSIGPNYLHGMGRIYNARDASVMAGVINAILGGPAIPFIVSLQQSWGGRSFVAPVKRGDNPAANVAIPVANIQALVAARPTQVSGHVRLPVFESAGTLYQECSWPGNRCRMTVQSVESALRNWRSIAANGSGPEPARAGTLARIRASLNAEDMDADEDDGERAGRADADQWEDDRSTMVTCDDCGHEYDVNDYGSTCPECGYEH